MTHKEITKHIRRRLRAEKIAARCKLDVSCGHQMVRIATISPDTRFEDHEQFTIKLIAIANKLTFVRGLPIDLNRHTNPHDFTFEVPA